MIFITAVENFILFSTMLALAGFTIAWASRRAAESGWWQPHPNTLARLYAAAIITPPVMAAWLVAAAFLPESWLGEAGFEAAHPAPFHQLHLLGDLTSTLEPVLAYFTLSMAAAAALFAASQSVRGYLRAGKVIERLQLSAAPPPADQLALVNLVAEQHGLSVGLVMSDYPFSFVWGFAHSKLVLSSGLLHALTPEELAGLLEHEAAHHTRRDNLAKLALTFCGHASLAFPLAWRLLRWRAEQVEMVCDEVAAARTSAPLEIAEALVKLRRRTLSPGGAPANVCTSGFIPEDSTSFEHRVCRVLALTDAPPTAARANVLSRSHKREALFVAATFAVTLIAVTALAPLAVHRAAESLIQIIR